MIVCCTTWEFWDFWTKCTLRILNLTLPLVLAIYHYLVPNLNCCLKWWLIEHVTSPLPSPNFPVFIIVAILNITVFFGCCRWSLACCWEAAQFEDRGERRASRICQSRWRSVHCGVLWTSFNQWLLLSAADAGSFDREWTEKTTAFNTRYVPTFATYCMIVYLQTWHCGCCKK